MKFFGSTIWVKIDASIHMGPNRLVYNDAFKGILWLKNNVAFKCPEYPSEQQKYVLRCIFLAKNWKSVHQIQSLECQAVLSAMEIGQLTIEIGQPHHRDWTAPPQRLDSPTIAIGQPHHRDWTAPPQTFNGLTTVGLFNGVVQLSNLYGGPVQSLWLGCSIVVFTTMQKEQLHRPGTKFYA